MIQCRTVKSLLLFLEVTYALTSLQLHGRKETSRSPLSNLPNAKPGIDPLKPPILGNDRSPTKARSPKLIFTDDDVGRALAYQAHVCAWSCLRRNFTLSLPKALIESSILRLSCLDCHCDSSCLEYGDCCGDYRLATSGVHPKEAQNPRYECLQIDQQPSGVLVISSCPETRPVKAGTKKRHNLNSNSSARLNGSHHLVNLVKPTTEAKSMHRSCAAHSVSLVTVGNLTYRNNFCLQCNLRRSLVSTDLKWTSSESCRKLEIKSSESKAHGRLETSCTVQYDKPLGAMVRPCDSRFKSLTLASECSINSKLGNLTFNQEALFDNLTHLCNVYRSPVVHGELVFNNIYCYLCYAQFQIPPDRPPLKSFSLALLTDLTREIRSTHPRHEFDSRGGVMDTDAMADRNVTGSNHNGSYSCSKGFTRFRENGKCRQMYCGVGRNLTLDEHSSSWTCTSVDRSGVHGYRLYVIWHVLGNVSLSQSRTIHAGKSKHRAKDSRKFSPTNGSDQYSFIEVKNGLKDDLSHGETDEMSSANASFRSVNSSNVYHQYDKASWEDDTFKHAESRASHLKTLMNLISQYTCVRITSLNVTRFCLTSCLRHKAKNATVEVRNNSDLCFTITDCITPNPNVSELFSRSVKKTDSFETSNYMDNKISLPQKQRGKNNVNFNAIPVDKNKKDFSHISSIELTGTVITSDLFLEINSGEGIDNAESYLLREFLGLKKLLVPNGSVDVELALTTGKPDIHSWSRCPRDENFPSGSNDRYAELTAVSACSHVIINFTDLTFTLEGRVIIEDLNVTLDRYQYFHGIDSTIMACVDVLEKMTGHESDFRSAVSLMSRIESILTIASFSLSFACLLMTLVTYSVIPALRSVPGKNNMVLVVSLLVSQTLLIVSHFPERDSLICELLGMALHYSWLCTVFWMSVCSLHMFRVFVIRKAGAGSGGRSHRAYLAKYLGVTNGAALAIVLSVVIASLYSSSAAETGYGKQVCYLDTPMLVALGFLLPLGLAVLSNIVLFSCTVLTISRLEEVKKHSRSERNNVHVYLRMSVLTGVCWTLALLAEVPGLDPLRCVSIVVNGSQGVFLFLSYTCNRRTLSLWKNVCVNSGARTSTRSSRNLTTMTNI